MPLKKKLKTQDENEAEEVDRVEEQECQEEDDLEDDAEDESMSDEDGSDSDEEEDINEEIMIDFEARSLRESDLDSAKLMIKQKLGPFQSININELARIVVEQESIGNAIYQTISNDDDDEEPVNTREEAREEEDNGDLDDTIFGILSVIDLASPKARAFAESFRSFLLKQCESYGNRNRAPTMVSSLRELLNTKKIAYIVNERYVNIPPAISVPMFASLRRDLEALSGEESACKDADYWLFLAKFFIETPRDDHNSNDDAARSSSRRGEASADQPRPSTNIYSNPEEEIFEEFSELKFDVSYSGRISNATSGKWSDSDASLTPNLRVFLVPRKNVADALAKVELLVK
jgi:protein BCP1